METLTCLAFSLMYINLLLMGFHCNSMLAFLLATVSVTPSWWLLSCLHDQMMVSPEFSPCFPAIVHLASVILMMARL